MLSGVEIDVLGKMAPAERSSMTVLTSCLTSRSLQPWTATYSSMSRSALYRTNVPMWEDMKIHGKRNGRCGITLHTPD